MSGDRAASGIQGQTYWSGEDKAPEAESFLVLERPTEGQNLPILVQQAKKVVKLKKIC